MRYSRALATAIVFLAICSTLGAQPIDQSRGVDARVDYASLTQYGPWDDRNYQLTLEDLAYLAPNEAQLTDAIPAFFRVKVRQAMPRLPKTGDAQYPRSALNVFRHKFGGYLIDGTIYKGVERQPDGRLVVIQENGIDEDDFYADPNKFLSGEVRVTSPTGAAESAIKINPVDTNLVIGGSNGPGAGQAMHWSTDGGETWTETALPLGSTCCDPTVDWSSDGTLAYAATLGECGFSGCAIWFYRSDDGGMTWTDLEDDTPGDPRRELTTTGSDKEFVHVDTFATSPHLDNVYLTWHDSNVMQFSVSTDSGNTWSTTSFGAEPTGIGSDITTDKSGNIYYFWGATGNREIRMLKSTDGGLTFAPSSVVADTNASFDWPIPAMDSRNAWIYAAADSDRSNGAFADSIYVAWTDTTAPDDNATAANNHTQVHVAYSRNGGTTWTDVIAHETGDANTVDRFNQWMAVGPDGTVHVLFYDTRLDLPDRSDVDIFYTSSTDGGQTYTTPPQRITAETSPNIADGFEWGDYNGLDAVLNDIIAIYTDNRDELGGGAESIDVYAAGIAGATDEIFADGFESGDTTAWSATVP